MRLPSKVVSSKCLVSLRYGILFFLFVVLTSSSAAQGVLTLEIRHLWEGQIIGLPAKNLPLPNGEKLEITRLAYLLSDPRVESKVQNGQSTWQERKNWQAFVNAASDVSKISLAGLPRRHFHSLQFFIGLDEKTNANDPNRYPQDHPLHPKNNLHWSWQGGYIFLAVEGRLHSSNTADPVGFSYHLGNAHNRMMVTLPTSFDLSKLDVTITIDFNLSRLFTTGPTPLNIADHTSTHGRKGDPTALTLVNNIEDAFKVHWIRSHSPESSTEFTGGKGITGFVGTPYEFKMPKNFPVPKLPVDYPLTEERVALGRRLFHDPLLSRSGAISCASCHQWKAGLSDSRRFSLGVTGRPGKRQSMPIFNMAWKDVFFWDGRVSSLRAQAKFPIQDSLEMHESLSNVEQKLKAHSQYPPLFDKAFGDLNITADRLGVAIEQFVLTLTSFDSKFDRASRGKLKLTEEESRGFQLFTTEYDPRRRQFGADCFHCHSGAFFTDHEFHNNGLTPGDDPGLAGVTHLSDDLHKFATPSLRNIALTAPYMHDGRFENLNQVLDHYSSGIVNSQTLDPNLAKHRGRGIPLSDDDKNAIIAFLHSLSDPQFSEIERDR
jgi:cytochrome c peroxidase